ncbi:MAG: glutamyl-tRNA reductase, partial [Eubacteriales bacterium]
QMQIHMIGIDHRVASIDIRQIFAMTSTEKTEFLSVLRENSNFFGGIFLSTCNRTEIWITGYDGCDQIALELLCNQVGVTTSDYQTYFTARHGEEAIAYLFSLSSGLTSQIFGEDQILTQVKDALDFARSCDATDTVLEVLFRRAITGAKEAKTMMQTSTANVGAAEFCLAQLSQEGYDYQGKTCMVIGNGKMGKRVALALASLGADVTVTVREYRSGHVEIPKGCKRIGYSQRLEMLPKCDLVASATASPNTTLKLEHFQPLILKKTLILLDLAVPRDIEPEIGGLENIRLFDIDSFHAPASNDLQQLEHEVVAMLESHVHEFVTWFQCRDTLPAIGRLAEKFATDTAHRMESAIHQQNMEDFKLFDEKLRDISQKQLKKLLFAIRDEAGAVTLHRTIAALEKLYE